MVPYLRAANVKDGAIDLTDVKHMNFTPSEQQIFSLRPGDVLVTEGSGSLRTVGASSVWCGEIQGTVCFQNTLIRLRPRTGTLDGRFLEWWARSAFASGTFSSIATGANIYHLSAERVRALPIDLPTIKEQQQIADFLDAETFRIDRLNEARIQQISLLVDRQCSNVSNIYSELSAKYGEIRLRHLLLRLEQGWSPQCEDRLISGDEWGVLKAGCVNGGIFDQYQHKTLPKHIAPRLEYQLQKGDLLMSRASGSPRHIGSTGIVEQDPGKLLLCDKVYRLTLDRKLADPRFIANILRAHQVREHIKVGISGGDGLANNLPSSVVKDCQVPKAPFTVQHQTASIIDTENRQIEECRIAVEYSEKLLSERRQALITAAVTGQFDVSTASGRGVEIS